MRILRGAIVTGLLALGVTAGSILASCERDTKSLAEHLQSYHRVFLGQVVSIVAKDQWGPPGEDGSVDYDDYEVTLRATRAWTPGVARTMVVRTRAGVSGSYPFQIGRMYLVFAQTRTDGGALDVNSCSPTRADQDTILAARALDELTTGYTPK